MANVLIIECDCGNSFAVPNLAITNNPKGFVTCKGLLRDRSGVCGRPYTFKELNKWIGKVDVYEAPERRRMEQLTLQNQGEQ